MEETEHTRIIWNNALWSMTEDVHRKWCGFLPQSLSVVKTIFRWYRIPPFHRLPALVTIPTHSSGHWDLKAHGLPGQRELVAPSLRLQPCLSKWSWKPRIPESQVPHLPLPPLLGGHEHGSTNRPSQTFGSQAPMKAPYSANTTSLRAQTDFFVSSEFSCTKKTGL